MLGVGILLARYLGTSGYGTYAYAMAVLTVLLIFADLGIAQYTLRNVAGSVKSNILADQQIAVRYGLQTTLLFALILSGIGLIFLSIFAVENTTALALVLILLPISAGFKFATYALRGMGKITLGQSLERLALPTIVFFSLWAMFSVVEWQTPINAIYIQVFAYSLVLLLATGYLLKQLQIPWHNLRLVSASPFSLARQSLPFALIGMVGILNTQIDILMLGWFTNPDQVGLYRVASLASVLVAFGLQAANVALPTLFARLQANQDQQQLQRLVTISARLILFAAIPVAGVLILFGDTLAGLVFGEAFTASYGPMVILVVGELVGASFGSIGFLLYMSNKEQIALRVLAGCALVNVILNAIMIPLFGMLGAAIATAIGQGLRVILLYRIVVTDLKLFPSPFRKLK